MKSDLKHLHNLNPFIFLPYRLSNSGGKKTEYQKHFGYLLM